MRHVSLIAACLIAAASSASAQITIVDTMPGAFVDISGTGTALSLGDEGEVDITTTIGNTLLSAGTVRVGSNGGARFNGGGQDLFAGNAAIPSTNAFTGDQSLLPFIMGPEGTIRVDLTDLPTNTPGSQMVMLGETLNFQCSYRDVANTNNFTDGRSVTF
ncbi:MAG: hypothetical protein GY711_06340 [bacterium]|nr:hypothetical protein [bacterium]